MAKSLSHIFKAFQKTSLFGKWNFNKLLRPADKPVAGLNLTIYSDKMECTITGDEIKVGGALVTLMLRHEKAHRIINNAVVAVNREKARQEADNAFNGLTATFNPN